MEVMEVSQHEAALYLSRKTNDKTTTIRSI